MRLRGRAVRLSLSLAALLTLSGCWDRTEVNDIAIVQGIALDSAGHGQIEVTVSIAIPAQVTPPGATGGSGEQGPPASNRAATARTVTEAMNFLQEKLSRRLFFAHNAVILIGEELAKEGVNPHMDFFARHRQNRLRTPIAVVAGRAADVLATTFPIELNVPVGIQEIERQQLAPFTDLRRFLQALVSEGEEPFTAVVHVATGGTAAPGTLRVPPDSAPEQRDPSQPRVAGAAVFRGGHLAGLLNETEARGILWARGELRTAITTVPLGDANRWVGFELIRASANLEPRVVDGRIVMRVDIKSEHDLVENPAGVDNASPKVIGLLEKALAREIETNVRRAIDKVQKELASDVLGFGEQLRRVHPDVWTEVRASWDELFPQVEVEVQVSAVVRRTGLAARPLSVRVEGLITYEELRTMLEGE